MRTYTPEEMRTVAARLRKPHSKYIEETAADVLDDAAQQLQQLRERIEALPWDPVRGVILRGDVLKAIGGK